MFNKILNAANNLFGKNQTLTLSLKTICSRLKIFVTMTNKRGAETRRDLRHFNLFRIIKM